MSNIYVIEAVLSSVTVTVTLPMRVEYVLGSDKYEVHSKFFDRKKATLLFKSKNRKKKLSGFERIKSSAKWNKTNGLNIDL